MAKPEEKGEGDRRRRRWHGRHGHRGCGGAWRAEAAGRIGELEGRVKAVRGGRQRKERAEPFPQRLLKRSARKEPPAGEEVLKAVDADICRAKRALEPLGLLRGICAWWSGSAITTAWEAVHVAELALLSVEANEEVRVVAPRLLSWIERTMDKGTQREAHETALKSANPTRAQVRGALADVIEANGNRYANLRAFRNTLILIMLALLVAVVGISVWHGVNPHFLSLCTSSTDATTGKKVTECLGTEGSSDGADVAMVAALGALGGLLAIAFSFSESTVAPTRYDPKTWQAFLKPITGAATAVVAVLLLQSNLLLKPVEQTQSMFLAYAVLFGFSQQLLTQFVDKRANSLITPDGS